MKFKSMLGSFVAGLAFASVVFADEIATTPFTISGESRVRGENDGRDFNSNTDMKSFGLMRTRFGIDVRPANDMSVFVQVQDSRLLGQQAAPTTPTPGAQQDGKLDLHQGFFQVNNLGWPGFGVKAGRMEVEFGNGRLISPNDWENAANNVFDGAMLTLNHNKFNGQALFANLRQGDDATIGTVVNPNQTDATMQAAFGTVAVNEFASTDLYVINAMDKRTASPDDDVRSTTLGACVHGKAQTTFDYSVEGAFQAGKIETGPTTKNDVGAFMFGGELGATVGDEARPVRFGAGYDYLSGDDNTTDTKDKAFSTLFGDEHKFYGLADIVRSDMTTAGLQDVKVNAKATVWTNENNSVKLGGEFHNFRFAQTTGTASNALGNEVDVNAAWSYRERFTPVLGFSAFLPGDAIPAPVGQTSADNSYWFYAQGTVSF